MPRSLLLISSSVVHGSGYLDHAEPQIRRHFAGKQRIVFVPYALADQAGYTTRVRERLAKMGIEVTSVHESPEPAAAIQDANGIFIGGGNTFRLLTFLHEK